MTATATTAAKLTIVKAESGTGWLVLDADGTEVATATSRAQARAIKANAEEPAEVAAADGEITTVGEELPEEDTIVAELEELADLPELAEAADEEPVIVGAGEAAPLAEQEAPMQDEVWGNPPVAPMTPCDDTCCPTEVAEETPQEVEETREETPAAEETTDAPEAVTEAVEVADGHRFVRGDSAHRCTCGKSRNAKVHAGQPAAPRVRRETASATTTRGETTALEQVVVRNLEIGARTNLKGVGPAEVTDKVKIGKTKFLVTFLDTNGNTHERELWASSRFRLIAE